MWYSWDLANVHFIAYSSEVFIISLGAKIVCAGHTHWTQMRDDVHVH
jgi:hypothetical protein